MAEPQMRPARGFRPIRSLDDVIYANGFTTGRRIGHGEGFREGRSSGRWAPLPACLFFLAGVASGVAGFILPFP